MTTGPSSSSSAPDRRRKRARSPSSAASDHDAGSSSDSDLALPNVQGLQLNIPSSPGRASVPPSSPVPFGGGAGDGASSDLDLEEEDLIPMDIDDGAGDDEPEDGIDLFQEDMLNRDYADKDGLDMYEGEDIDDDEYDSMTAADRAAAEAELRRRDILEGRLPAAFLDDGDDMDQLELRPRRRRRRDAYDDDMDMDGGDGADWEGDVLLEGIRDLQSHSAVEWLAMDRTRVAVKREFRAFLMSYTDAHSESVYGRRIKTMCELNLESLQVSYMHMENNNPVLAYLLTNYPMQVLPLFDEAALEVVLVNFPEYREIHQEIHVRMTELPTVKSIRDLRETDLNSLVRLSGVVTRRSGVFPQLKYVKYDCVKCGQVIGPIHQDSHAEVRVNSCPNCQSHGPFNINTQQTVYRNFQKLTLQETPGTVPPGRLPRHREVILLWDLIDCARPGEEIEVVGVYRHNFDLSLNNKNGFPVFSTVIEANSITKREDEFAALRLTQDDIDQIKQLAKDPKIGRRLIKSIAPSIYGHEDIKTALCLALFGGVPKNVKNKHRIRGDINVLLLGDPGTAKSQFLKYVEKTAHRAVYTTGQGASAVGLTASVRKDPVTKEWTLEGGALVLADKGVCLIDEFDKMNDADRTSIHEAMEQQSISISKAGIVTSLHARCCIVAAANPIRGRYNTQIPFSQNVDLTEPILSRFDVLCVVKDRVDPEMDDRLAEFVVSSHRRSHPLVTQAELDTITTRNDDATIIPQDLLKKYIMYAKEKIQPQLSAIDEDKVGKLYSELRRESLQTGSIPITVRHLESILRMSEAHARMHLRDHVRPDDTDLAISVMLDSFISAQKYTVMRQLRKAFAKYIRYHRDNDELLLFTLNDLVREALRMQRLTQVGVLAHHAGGAVGGTPAQVLVSIEELAARARDLNIHDVDPFLESNLFAANGFRVAMEGGKRRIVKSLHA
ncbi:MCM2/3/5 family-domain-containing protein [Catenaria anguillulae PL171]|uniref:DNA replication licensing factor MCM2 n=1 Tax=Catenaria anguillulae PL171 TaxID=765915 RepID=A0A1Y2HSW9_9FUNG|nr:MCM2/3/5 family-domain-containing protein [Catenaria anguillulae PL171]